MELAEDHTAASAAILSLGEPTFGPALLAYLRQTCPFDNGAIILFSPVGESVPIEVILNECETPVFRDSYMQGSYLLDPFYQICKDGKSGLYHLRDIAPHGFFQSSYCRDYFGRAHIYDEMDYIVQTDNGISAMVSLTRKKAIGRFQKREREQLAEKWPTLKALIIKHLRLNVPLFDGEGQTIPPHSLQDRLDQFGSEQLTGREYQIVHLMLRGYSSKAAANYLDISPATERTHRKSIYRKMAVNSHAELLADAFSFLLEAKSGG